MSTCHNTARQGQALVLVTFSLATIIGVLALATDVGWSHYVRKSAQTAADAGAMAAALEAIAHMGNGRAVCGTGGNATCQPDPSSCASSLPTKPTNNLETGCLYAQRNGFRTGGRNGRQTVTIASNAGTPPPTAPGVNDVYYWVTVTAQENVPRMFSALMSKGDQEVTARATAVITNGSQGGTLYLINRQNDTSGVGTGLNVDMGGNTTVNAPGGIYMASTRDYAAKIQGSPKVTAPFTWIRETGTVASGGTANWTAAPENGHKDAWYFRDPMSGNGQPPLLPTTGLGPTKQFAVLNGDLSTLSQPIPSGQYYAVDSKGKATAAQLTVGSGVIFQDGNFGNYVFYGGLNIGTNAKFYPGRYVLAGVKANSGNGILAISNGGRMTDNTAPNLSNTDAGEIFIFTDASNPGLDGSRPGAIEAIKSSLVFGSVELQAGDKQIVTLHGLNRTSSNVPDSGNDNLKTFAPSVFWQDQRNSRVKYDGNGNVDIGSCGSGHTLDSPCTNAAMANSTTPRMKLQAHPNTSLYGMIYQPRGAWMDLQGNGSIVSPMVLITGAIVMDGGCDIALLDSRDQLKRKVVALVE